MSPRSRFIACFLSISIIATASAVRGEEGVIHTVNVKLATPKSGKDKRAPRPLDSVPFAMWTPPGVKTIRGAVFNPFYVDAVKQKHWRAACSQWDFALVSANYFGVKNDDFKPSLLSALKQLGETAGHPELEHIPFCYVGMSAGAGMSMRFVELLPDRSIAAGPVCLEVGPRDEASMHVPTITVFGERDGKQMEKLAAKLPAARQVAAHWTTAVQWGRRHEFGQANNLLMPFFDHVIRKRYSADLSPRNGPVALHACPACEGWLTDMSSWDSAWPTVVAAKDVTADTAKMGWLPDAYVAAVWRAFVAKGSPLRIVEPAGMGDGQPFVLHQPDDAILMKVKVKDDAVFKVIEWYDGDRKVAEMPGDRREAAPLKWSPGIHTLIAVGLRADGTRVASQPNTFIVGK